jgi:hypothetical protein
LGNDTVLSIENEYRPSVVMGDVYARSVTTSSVADAHPLRVTLLAAPGPGAGVSAQALTPTLWLRPSLDLQLAVRDGLTRQWHVGLTPGVGYGIAWCPPGWRLTPELLALDVHASALLTDGELRAQALLMLTLGGVVTVGAGLDAALGSGAVPDRAGLAVAVGLRYAL